MRDYRIPKAICFTLPISLKVQTFLVLLSILLHDFKSEAPFSFCVPLTISLEVPQDKTKKGIGLEKANTMNGLQFSTTV